MSPRAPRREWRPASRQLAHQAVAVGQRCEAVQAAQQVRLAGSPLPRSAGRHAGLGSQRGGVVGLTRDHDVQGLVGAVVEPVGDGGHVDGPRQPAGGLRAAPHGAPLQDPAVADRGGPVLGHHHLDRAGDDHVDGAPVGLDHALAEQVRRTALTVPGEPCRRNRRRHGSGHGEGSSSGVGRGTSGSRCTRTPTARRISCSSGTCSGSMAGVPNRLGAAGQGRGTSRRPRPGCPGRHHPVRQLAQPVGFLACGQVDPPDQLEVDGVRQWTPECHLELVPAPLVAPGRPGRRTSGAEVRGPSRTASS